MRNRTAILFVTAATLVASGAIPGGLTAASAVEEDAGGVFVPLTPTNVWTSLANGGDMTAGSSREVQVMGVGGVPSVGVGAVVVDIGGYSNGNSHITVSPKGGPSWTPVLKMTSNQDQHSNTVVVPPGTGGKIVVTSSAGGATKLNIDVQGYFTEASGDGSAGGYVSVFPERVLATNAGVAINGKLNAGSSYAVQVAGVGEIPEDATAVFANVRVFDAAQAGGLYVGTTSPVPTTWNALAYEDGRYNDSGLSLKLSPSGRIHLRPSNGPIHVVIDVQGYFAPADQGGGSYTPLSNGYYYDTYALSNPLQPGETRTVRVLGRAGIPENEQVGAIVTTIQAHNWSPSGGGALAIYNPDTGRNGTSNIAFSGTYSMPEMSTSLVGVSVEGNVAIHNYSDKRVHITLAAQGWFRFAFPWAEEPESGEDVSVPDGDSGDILLAAEESLSSEDDSIDLGSTAEDGSSASPPRQGGIQAQGIADLKWAKCDASPDNPHWSGNGNSVVAKLWVSCSGNVTSVKVRIWGAMSRKTTLTANPKIVAYNGSSKGSMSGQVQTVFIGVRKRFYLPREGVYFLHKWAYYRGGWSGKIVEPGFASTLSSGRSAWQWTGKP